MRQNKNLGRCPHGHFAILVSSILLASQAAPAATLAWNNGTANGQWDTTSANWLNDITAAAWNNGTPDSAVFADTAVGTVTLTAGITASGMDFATTGYTITGNTLTLAAGSASPLVNVTGSSTIGSVIAGANGFTKTGNGTLTLGARNSFTGTMRVSSGTVEINNAPEWAQGFAGSNATVEIDSGATVKLNVIWALGFTNTCDDVIIHDGGALDWNLQTTFVRHVFLEGSANISGNTGTDSPVVVSGNLTATPTDAAAPQLEMLRLSGSAYSVVGGTTTFTVNDNVNHAADLTIGPIGQASPAAVLKSGAGTMLMTGTNSYTGSTTVNNGSLVVQGRLATGGVTVRTGATLGGNGTLNGPVAIEAGGTLSTDPSGISTLSVNHSLALAGDTRLRIHSGSLKSDRLSGMTGITYGGSLTVSDLGSGLAAGQKFTLFTMASGTYDGSFETLSLPTPPAGLEWNTTGLAIDGSIQLTALNQVAAPLFIPGGGGYSVPVSVTISSDPESTIYYTTNGDTPTLASEHGPSPVVDIIVPLDTRMTIQAFVTKTGMADSAVASAVYTTLATTVWLNPTGGSWTDASNWLSEISASGAGSTADFSTLDLTADAAVTLNGVSTVGKLVFGDTTPDFNWTLTTGGPLSLDAGSTMPVIEVKNQITSLAVALAGTNGFTKTGNGTLVLAAENSFTGTMKVSGGTVEINKAPEWWRGFAGLNAKVEIDSGAAVKFNTVWALGFTNACDDLTIHDGGTLNCNGLSTYLRDLVLEGSGNISNNTQVDSNISLSGNLTTTPTDSTAPQLQLLRLSGSVYGVVGGTTTFTVNDNAKQPVDLTIGPIFQSSPAALLKTGAGTMLMTGANVYTGPTTVNNGSLLLTGSIATGTVTVNANATLGGTGTINSTTTIADNGRLAFTLSTLAAAHDPLDITGALIFSGASVLDITASGVLPASGVYPLVVATAPITGNVPATLNLPSGWAASVSISADTLSLLLTVTSTGSNPYDTWSNGTFANAFTDKATSHDPDSDGLTNLQEYAYGTDPTLSSSGQIVYDATQVTTPGSPTIVKEGGVYYAVFGRRADYLTAGIRYAVRFSADLEAGAWTTSITEPTELTSTGAIHAVRVPYPIELVPSVNGPQSARYFQVGVTQTP